MQVFYICIIFYPIDTFTQLCVKSTDFVKRNAQFYIFLQLLHIFNNFTCFFTIYIIYTDRLVNIFIYSRYKFY